MSIELLALIVPIFGALCAVVVAVNGYRAGSNTWLIVGLAFVAINTGLVANALVSA